MTTKIPLSAIQDYILIMENQLPDGSSEGGISNAVWNIRELNTEVYNTIPDCTTNTGTFTFTLPIGTYLVDAYAQGYSIGTHQIRIRNITDSTTDLLGTKNHSTTATSIALNSEIRQKVLIVTGGSKTFQLQQYATNAGASNGGGYGTTAMDGVGIFAGITVRKIK